MASTNSSSTEQFLSTSENGLTPSKVIANGAVMTGLSIIAVGLRFFARIKFVKARLGLDDWLILVAMVGRCFLSLARL